MAENSEISWTENTFNPWIGCTKVSAGCAHCYAERDWGEGSRRNRVKWGASGTRSMTSEDNWAKPLRWNKQAEKTEQRIKVFCASLADVFEAWDGPMRGASGSVWLKHPGHNPGPKNWNLCDEETYRKDNQGWQLVTMDDVRRRLFALIDHTPNLDWLLVTKRPENIRRFWPEFEITPFDREEELLTHRKNVWLLTSVENQEASDTRIPELLKCRDLAPVLGLSCEPLLGPVDLKLSNSYQEWANGGGPKECSHGIAAGLNCRNCNRLDWVIAGGESGPDARPMHPDWARSLRDQCQAAGVSFHFKQWGEFCDESSLEHIEGPVQTEATLPWADMNDLCPMYQVGKKRAGRLLDGREWDEFPKVGA